MINKDTYSTVLTNGISASVSLTQPVTNSTTLANRTAVSSTLNNISFGVLWFEQLQTWAGTTKTWRELSDNVVLTNL